ncbi:MAG: helix-turn-helix domain-containing protein [Elusimicrobia bacterium]|nr:helix-turn-helix domain-containing protein [Candidatus Liberimonas magnetica]
MKTSVSFDEIKKEALKNPEFKKAFDKAHTRALIAVQIEGLRKRYRLTQRQMAKKLKITQQTVSKIERHDNNVTIGTLEKIASMFHKQLVVEFR